MIFSEEKLEKKITDFSRTVKEKLLKTKINKGFKEFMSTLCPSVTCYVVSGGKETELHEIFKEKDIAHYFKGIYGSPKTKNEIINSLGEFQGKSLFLGDSRLDYETSKTFNMDFVFFSDLTEFESWETFFRDKDVRIVANFSELL
jgi:phosphoglycolate phosphatase-like HAD superfamily hydrolase